MLKLAVHPTTTDVPPTRPTAKAAPGEAINVRGLSRIFADGSGLQSTNLTINSGEFLSVLGPSGCGKSTLLRCVAGLETADAGTIMFGTASVYDRESGINVPPRDRGLGMVFQDLALWPHLSTQENVAFPLRVSRTPKAEIADRVRRALDLVGLSHFAEKMPHQLSGGQQQRVAIARAIVAKPRVLLMDEPFSALDAALRLQLRDELRDLTTSLGLTTLYVTHDQAEAMAMSDRIAVLDQGVLRQVSTPEELYQQPTNRFVADFIGRCNWLPDRFGKQGVRPEHVSITAVKDSAHTVQPTSAPGVLEFQGMIISCTYTGGFYTLACMVDGAETAWSLENPERLTPGTPVQLTVPESAVMRVQ